MKTKISIIILIILILSGCTSNKLKVGRYLMVDAPHEEYAWVLIEEDNKFEFNRNFVASYRPSGNYTINNNELILEANEDEVYRFEIAGDTLIFKSSTHSQELIGVGTTFKLEDKK